jgi:hypothetical protein
MTEHYYFPPSLDVDLTTTLDRIVAEVNLLDGTNIPAIESNILSAQYSYVKLGLLLEKVKSGKLWEFFTNGYQSFKSFCQGMLGITNWQAINLIKSAKVAIELRNQGYTELPKNPSQAIELAGLTIEKMMEVWDRVTTDNAPHQITAAAIKATINPDAQPSKASISIPVALRDRIAAEAMELGISSAEYLEQLVNGELEVGSQVVETPAVSDEDRRAIDLLEQSWEVNPNTKKYIKSDSPKPTVEEIKTSVVNGFDNLMNSILGEFVRPRSAPS